MPTTLPNPTADLAARLTALRANWGWFVALGVAFVILGFVALAHLVASSYATALYVGALILVGGIVQVVHAFRVQDWSRFSFWLLCGLLYGISGLLIIAQPLLAAGIITLVLGVSLVINGAFRIAAGLGSRGHEGWGWIVFSGTTTLLLGAIIIAGWPLNGLMILGLLLGVDLVINGVATVFFGLALRGKGA